MKPNEVFDAFRFGRLTLCQAVKELEDWRDQGEWIPANNRTETAFITRTGRRLLYVYQPRSERHAYLDLETDTILTNEEAKIALGD